MVSWFMVLINTCAGLLGDAMQARLCRVVLTRTKSCLACSVSFFVAVASSLAMIASALAAASAVAFSLSATANAIICATVASNFACSVAKPTPQAAHVGVELMRLVPLRCSSPKLRPNGHGGFCPTHKACAAV